MGRDWKGTGKEDAWVLTAGLPCGAGFSSTHGSSCVRVIPHLPCIQRAKRGVGVMVVETADQVCFVVDDDVGFLSLSPPTPPLPLFCTNDSRWWFI